ncbi:helix-turn-helix domain-containing protein, partial [Acinetobacter sp. 243_ASPC]|uniref:helix-turn-helix domain-containing protein n=1 Tax=Acinetobacter sp. 243_ASPC TaxID=1579345 RepID=UPI00137920F5
MAKVLIDLIDRARWKAGSYKAVAEKMGISSARLSEYKSGHRNPSAFAICQLADIAELDPKDVLFEVMQEVDSDHSSLWEKWCARRGSNPRPQAS